MKKLKTSTSIILFVSVFILSTVFTCSLVFGVMQSLDYFPLAGESDLSFAHYTNLLHDSLFWKSLLYTIYLAVAAVLISVIGAIVIAMSLRHNFRHKKIVLFIYQLSLPIPHLVSAIMILFAFSQTGVIATIAANLGWLEDANNFPKLIYDDWGIGIIASLAWKFIPFIGVAILGILQVTGREYEEQAMSLGANAWHRFADVLFPLMCPAIISTTLLAFPYAFGVFEIPFLLSGNFPIPVSLLANNEFNSITSGRQPVAMAMVVVMLLALFLLMLLFKFMFQAMFRLPSEDKVDEKPYLS